MLTSLGLKTKGKNCANLISASYLKTLLAERLPGPSAPESFNQQLRRGLIHLHRGRSPFSALLLWRRFVTTRFVRQ